MKNVKQEFTTHTVVWSKPFGDKYAYCLTDDDPNNKSGLILYFDDNSFNASDRVKLTNTLVPSSITVSGWLKAHSFLEVL